MEILAALIFSTLIGKIGETTSITALLNMLWNVVDAMKQQGQTSFSLSTAFLLAVIECKSPKEEVDQAVSQQLSNQGREYLPHLFAYGQLLVAFK